MHDITPIMTKEQMRQLLIESVKQALQDMGVPVSQKQKIGLLSIRDAAVRLNLSPKTVYKYAQLGKIEDATPQLRVYRFSEEALTNFLKGYRNIK